MATADDLEQKLTCSICLQLFQDPRLLPCGHTYCQHCLTTYINSRPPATNSRGQPGFLCPVCREFLPAPDRMTPPHLWACRFKPNFLIRDIVEVHGKNKRRGADCSSINNTSISNRPPCPRHPGKPVELYCRDCRTSVCDRCVALHHRKCEEVVELAEVSRETQQATRKHQQTVTQLMKQLEAKKRRCMTGRRELERIERDMDAKIEREGQELLRKVADFLRSRKESLKRQAHAHCRQCVNVVNAYTEKCEELTEALRSLDRVLANKLRPHSSQYKTLDLQEERRLSGMIQKLEMAVQQLDSPCHFTVRLIMDDSALTAILATLKLGEIRTGNHSDGIPAVCSTSRPSSVASSSCSSPATSPMNLSVNGLVGHQQSGGVSSSVPERPSSAASNFFSSSSASGVHPNNRSSPMNASSYSNGSTQLPAVFSPYSAVVSFSTSSSSRSGSPSSASASGTGAESSKTTAVASATPHPNHHHHFGLRGRVVSDSRLSSHAANNDSSSNGGGSGGGGEVSNLLPADAVVAAQSLHVPSASQSFQTTSQQGRPLPPAQRRKSVTKMPVDCTDQPALPPRRKLSQP